MNKEILILCLITIVSATVKAEEVPLEGYDAPFIRAFDDIRANLQTDQLEDAEKCMIILNESLFGKVFARRKHTELRYIYASKLLNLDGVGRSERIIGFSKFLNLKLANTEDKVYMNKVPLDDGSFGVDKKKLADIFKRFIVGPCQYYTKNFGAKVFEPYNFIQMSNVGKADRFCLNTNTQVFYPFYDGWSTYTTCKLVVSDPYLAERYANLIAETAF